MGLLDGAKKDGLKTEMGGGRLSQKGYYIAPTIFTDVSITAIFRRVDSNRCVS